MISIRKRASVLLAGGLMTVAVALAGCDLLPFGQTPAAPPVTTTPATSTPATTAPTAESSGTLSLDEGAQAAITASLTAPAPLDDQIQVPDVTGMDAKTAQDALKDAHLDYILSWSGDAMATSRRVVSQNPPPGSQVASGTRVAILAATGKGEGRPFPIWYYGTVSDREFGLRGSGTVMTMRFPAPEGKWIAAVGTMKLPMEIYVIDDCGRWYRLFQSYKSGGRFHQRLWVHKVRSDGNDRLYRDYQIYVRTPNSTWWDARYGFFSDGEIPNLTSPAGSPSGAASGGGGGDGL